MRKSSSSPRTPRAAKLLTIDLGADLKTRWQQWCQAQGHRPSQALRALIEDHLAKSSALALAQPAPTPRVRISSKGDTGPKVQQKIYFTPSESAALSAVAAAQGYGRQDFIIAAVRAALAKAPTYGQAELEVLTRSNAHLVNLIEALGALRAEPAAAAVTTRLDALEHTMTQHFEQVSAAMAQGTRRWQLTI